MNFGKRYGTFKDIFSTSSNVILVVQVHPQEKSLHYKMEHKLEGITLLSYALNQNI